jgi:hypothetical protein
MSNVDHERLREIESSAKKVDELAQILEFQRQEAKLARQAWEAAVERHLELCRATEDSQDVADAPLLRRIEEAEANGQPIVADAVTEPPEPASDHEEDEPDWHGEPLYPPSEFYPADGAGSGGERLGHPLDQAPDVIGDEPSGWDLVTSQPLSDDAKAEADALAKIESGAKRAKGRKRSKAQQG